MTSDNDFDNTCHVKRHDVLNKNETVVTYKHDNDNTCHCSVTRQDNGNRKIGLEKATITTFVIVRDKARQCQQKSYCHAEPWTRCNKKNLVPCWIFATRSTWSWRYFQWRRVRCRWRLFRNFQDRILHD